jgi:hydroxymethylbilane synthase
LAELPANARIGTSSLRRQCQIKAQFPNAEILSLRGNVNTRLAKLDADEYDAIILASAGLKRLGLGERITKGLDSTESLPAIGQGAIGIECRIDDAEIHAYLKVLHDEETSLRVRAERAMNARLNGGCQVPIAGFAEIKGDKLWLRGLVGSPDGAKIYRAEAEANFEQAEQLGIQVANDLLAQGAEQILRELYQ